MRMTTTIVAFLALLLISCIAMPFLVGQTFALVDDFTHAVLGENFGYPS